MTLNEMLGWAVCQVLHSQCPACGHLSIMTIDYKALYKCVWPDCRWSGPVGEVTLVRAQDLA